MEKIIESIEKHGSQYLIGWLSDLEKGKEVLPANFNWLYFAEKISSMAFSEEHCNIDFAKSAILIYERIFQVGNQGAILSALNLRLRILDVVPSSELEPFFKPDIVVETIKKCLPLPMTEVESMATNWQKLEVKNIKILREIKNLITILIRFEKSTNQEFDEFLEWKKIFHLLP